MEQKTQKSQEAGLGIVEINDKVEQQIVRLR